MTEGRFIESLAAVFGSGYILKKSGNDLFWNGKLRNLVLNLLYVGDYTLEDLGRLLCTDTENVSMILQNLQEESPSLVRKYESPSDGDDTSCYTITSEGETFSSPNFVDKPPANTESFSQVRIGQIDIQNLETKADELISMVAKEPNLSEENKKILKEKLTNLKNTWNETQQFGQQISSQLTLEGLKELFPKSLI